MEGFPAQPSRHFQNNLLCTKHRTGGQRGMNGTEAGIWEEA